MSGKGDKFAGVEYIVSRHGLPLLPDVIAAIECRIHSVTDAGDHYFVPGRRAGAGGQREGDPMLFFKGRYGGFADCS